MPYGDHVHSQRDLAGRNLSPPVSSTSFSRILTSFSEETSLSVFLLVVLLLKWKENLFLTYDKRLRGFHNHTYRKISKRNNIIKCMLQNEYCFTLAKLAEKLKALFSL